MLRTSRKLLSSLTLFAFVFAFTIPLFVVIESAKASYNVIYVRDHTTYYVCRCPDRPLWIIVDCWVDPDWEIAWYNHPPKKNGKHVFHNVTENDQTTWEYAKLPSSDYRCGTIEDECEEC